MSRIASAAKACVLCACHLDDASLSLVVDDDDGHSYTFCRDTCAKIVRDSLSHYNVADIVAKKKT